MIQRVSDAVERVLGKLEELGFRIPESVRTEILMLSEAFARKIKDDLRVVPGHEIDHTIRVLAMSLYIGARKGGDLRVISTCSLFHDIARILFPDVENHSKKSAEMAKSIIIESDLNFSENEVEKIVKCIEEHSWSANLKPSSLESMIVQDADRLDALGFIGVARVFSYGGYLGRPMSSYLLKEGEDSSHKHFYEKILKLPSTLNTDEARRIAERKVRKLEGFIKEFEKEIESFGLCDVS